MCLALWKLYSLSNGILKYPFVSGESNLAIIMAFEENVSVVILFRLFRVLMSYEKGMNAEMGGVW